jgi:sialidase-1
MSGNVSEWCQDWHGYYFDGESVDPVGPSAAAHRVLRGGGWTATGGRCRSSRRDHEEPKAEHSHIGFRIALGAPAPRPAGEPVFTDVFVAGEGGVSTYRIPAMITAPDGSLLAFCEARKIAQDDASPTDMILRRSLDEGKTWLPVQTLVPGTGVEALMNPCAVVNRKSGEVVLVGINAHKTGPDHHRCLVLKSADNGVTWSAPRDITETINNADDRFVPGPGIGVQMENGRLVIPGYIGQTTIEIEESSRSCVMFSDDGGDTWTMGTPVADLSDESQVVSLKDGRLMLNMRGNMGRSCRGVATSTDGGASWSTVRWDAALNECPCQASILRYSAGKERGKDGILFANPDNFGELYGVVERTKMTVRMSYDEGATWPVKRLIHAGPSSYSTLVQLSNGDIGILFEGGEKHRREWIRFARFSMEWLTAGEQP